MNPIALFNLGVLIVQTILAIVIVVKGYKIHNTLYYNAIGMLVMNFGLVYMMIVQTIFQSFNQTLIYSSSFVIFLIHYERFLHENPFQPSVIFAFFILSIKLTILFVFSFWASTQDPATLLTSSDSNASEMYRIIWIDKSILGNMRDFFISTQIITTRILVLIIAIRMVFIMHKIHIRHHINGTLWDRNGLILILIFAVLGLTFIPEGFMIGQFFAIIGLFIILVNNIKHPDYAFKIPTSIVSIIIYNEYGILVYARRFLHEHTGQPENETLLSGYLVGISQLITDSLGEQVTLHHLDAEPFKIEFYSFKTSRINCAIISYGVVPYLQRSFRLLEKNLTEGIKIKINSPIVNKTELQSQIDAKVKQVFPFLDFK